LVLGFGFFVSDIWGKFQDISAQVTWPWAQTAKWKYLTQVFIRI